MSIFDAMWDDDNQPEDGEEVPPDEAPLLQVTQERLEKALKELKQARADKNQDKQLITTLQDEVKSLRQQVNQLLLSAQASTPKGAPSSESPAAANQSSPEASSTPAKE